ncbi:hypothetical protein TVAG_158550 [Trichomonas vaginalis G3]|uniref:Uncharacterized protein n=1 Tax=Trichomonas vaginalis (strain ATCC PRA-98 / G3) TaxID=412133 RepID=A2E6N8_TRIV3|nr:guanylate cyclase protein [Trichomonas vaginalis G3]EAY11632.1 hypothetical protein TVAG_158550 [Trichomonas vaginalis G3]KAI5494963.1 guanylate cyclase protein [Trichomonas vaginalis G3]|eukprot:XP_001323855.1 hypothetical protein [Trichomonas vaginalis G3]
MITIVLDLNLIYLYIFNKSTYNYTIIILLVVTILAHPVGQIVFGQLVKKTKEQLTYDDDITNKTEYFDELGICKNSLWATRFIVIGLSELCDYFVDGSITEYIINHVETEGILALLLQIVTYFPSESQKLSILYKRLISMRKLTFINRFLIYQISKIKTRRLTSNTKDTTDLYNKLHTLNEEVKATIRSFWDKPNAGHSFVEMLSYRTKKLNRYFQYFLESNPNNIKITTEYTNFLVECLCD